MISCLSNRNSNRVSIAYFFYRKQNRQLAPNTVVLVASQTVLYINNYSHVKTAMTGFYMKIKT
jgi:hypothetical protein